MNFSQLTDEKNNRLDKVLISQESQAYEGAKMFYYWVIPASILYIAAIHAYILEQHLRSADTSNQYQQFAFAWTKIIAIIITYYYALKVYHRCNEIDTTPVLSQKQSQQQIISDRLVQEISQYTSDKLISNHKPKKVVCNVCKITCDYRTRHCRKCQVCIQRYDHHCFWIGNCVGRHNHKHFYYFLILQTIVNTLSLLSLWGISDLQMINHVGFHFSLECLKIGLEILTVGFICFTGYLFIYHTMLITSGITTWQHMRRSKISYLKHLPPGYNPFSRGSLYNWKAFFANNTRSDGHEQEEQWDEFVPTYQESKLLQPVCNLIDNQYYSCC